MSVGGRFLPAAIAAAMLVAGVVVAAPPVVRQQQAPFPHDRHATLFPLCTTCHAGVIAPAEPMWPDPSGCASCHDRVVRPVVTWAPRAGPRASNLRFTHEAHDRAVTARNPADSSLNESCASCHNPPSAPRMAVRPPIAEQCLECHGIPGPHVDAPRDACATCHVPLTEARTLTREDIAGFPRPASHEDPGFRAGGHGTLAAVPTPGAAPTVAASCATCHSRDLCLSCHVNAPESPVIQALALDARAPAFVAAHAVPASHLTPAFLRTHGRDAQRATATCATCHTRSSCMTCHSGSAPRVVAALPESGPGRARGVDLVRAPPSSHTWEFRERHGPEANARPATCETCHARSACLECHRPENARPSAYHPSGFLTRHPSAAYSREANCSDCHNPAQFCQGCHQQSGLVARARLGRAGYHDAFRGFSLGHGQAARQSLESCVACHAERDCTACHSAGGGFRFNPHGPGFNPSRARAKNPSVCIACHGTLIPGAGERD